MTNPFVKATKKRSKLRLAIDGPSGSGKTWTSLVTAEALADGGRIAVIDTEHGSASLYSDRFDFDVLELDHYDPANYVRALRAAEQNGYAVAVIDSLSHAWDGEGGVQEIVDKNAKGGNTWSGWAKGTPAYRSLITAILASSIHVIGTMRTKTEWVTPEKGKAPVKIGTAPVMRQGIDYEFTVVADMDLDHTMTVSKSRCPLVADRSIRHPDGQFGRELLAWLNDGGDPTPTVWEQRFAQAIDLLGGSDAENRVRILMNGADPAILTNDDAWVRLQHLVENSEVPSAPHSGGTGASGASDAGAAGNEDPAPRTITTAQLRRLAATANELGIADAEWKAIACHVAGVTSRKHIPADRYDAVEAAMREAAEDAANTEATAAVAGEGA